MKRKAQTKKTSWLSPPQEKGIRFALIRFLWPTKWKIILMAFLYFSSSISFFGVSFLGMILNFPIFYIHGNWPPATEIAKAALFALQLLYFYVLSAIFVRIFG